MLQYWGGILKKKFVKFVVQDLTSGGHEWMRAKWSAPIRKYWKISEQMMVKYGNVAARMNSINANKDTFKMYTDMFLTEYIILAIHLNSQGALSDVVLNKVKKNANLMV